MIKRFFKCLPYFNKKYYYGHIRWLLMNKKGENVFCCSCGNIANGIVTTKIFRLRFNLPACKVHLKANSFPCIIEV